MGAVAMRAGKEWARQHYNSSGSARLFSLMSTATPPGARRRAADRPPALARAADGAGPGAVRLRRRADPPRRAGLSRRLGSEAAGHPLRLRGAAHRLGARCRRPGRRPRGARRWSRRCSGRIGSRLGGPLAGGLSAVLFLLLSDPEPGALRRLPGPRAVRRRSSRSRSRLAALALGARRVLRVLRVLRCSGSRVLGCSVLLAPGCCWARLSH